ncbi:hypothetical protein ACFQU2_04715 [Siccirubricoccus deserti]
MARGARHPARPAAAAGDRFTLRRGAALRAGQPEAAAAALPATIFPQGGQVTLTRLAALPDLPRTNTAAVGATEVLRRAEGDRRGRL